MLEDFLQNSHGPSLGIKKKSVASVSIVAMVMLKVDGSSKHNDSHSGR